MTLTVQSDAGTVSAANGYITAAAFTTYHTDRAQAVPTGTVTADIEAAIVRATTYMDGRWRYRGRRLNDRTTQTTEWPRANCYDNDRHYVNGIPREVKDACAEYALRALSGELAPDPEYSSTGATVQAKSEKVGPIEESTEYASGGVFALPRYPVADNLLRRAGLTESGGTMRRG